MKFHHFAALILILPLMACKQSEVLYADLTEREANEMLALLFSAGMSAQKVLTAQKTGKGVSYAVETSHESFPHAMMLLQANDLPRERFMSMGDMFAKGSSIVSTALEETARLNHALSEELSATLSNIDGVTLARVHLALPKKSMLTGDVQASSAAVFVKHRETVSLDKELTKIKALVVDSIENLAYDDVTVVFFEQKSMVYPSYGAALPVAPRIQRNEAAPVMLMQAINASTWFVIALLLFATLVGSFILAKFKPAQRSENVVRH